MYKVKVKLRVKVPVAGEVSAGEGMFISTIILIEIEDISKEQLNNIDLFLEVLSGQVLRNRSPEALLLEDSESEGAGDDEESINESLYENGFLQEETRRETERACRNRSRRISPRHAVPVFHLQKECITLYS
jgi:hypothetical protein